MLLSEAIIHAYHYRKTKYAVKEGADVNAGTDDFAGAEKDATTLRTT